MSALHPNQTYESLMQLARHPVKRRNLEAVHETCKSQHNAGSVSFTFAEIGRLLEANGVITAKALNNPQSKDYRTLIAAWAAYARPTSARTKHEGQSWLMKITDPVVRQLVQLQEAEVEKLRGEVHSLRKLQGSINVYLGAAAPAKGEVTVVDAMTTLTPTERQSVANAIDEQYLASKGLAVGIRGEIKSSDGKVLFERGFAEGVKKLLGG